MTYNYLWWSKNRDLIIEIMYYPSIIALGININLKREPKYGELVRYHPFTIYFELLFWVIKIEFGRGSLMRKLNKQWQ